MDVYCKFCGGKAEIIKKQYGGYAYECPLCGARVPCNKQGIFIKNKRWRSIKQLQLAEQCHNIIDTLYKTPLEKQKIYKNLARELKVPLSCCHFSMLSNENMKRALNILNDVKDGKKVWKLS